jgi:hypothetical protein
MYQNYLSEDLNLVNNKFKNFDEKTKQFSFQKISRDAFEIIPYSPINFNELFFQDEVEIFQEQFLSPPPPEPIRPGQVISKRYAGSSKGSSSLQQNDSFRENFKL